MSAASPPPALDFRLAPEYRRCAVYTAVGFALLVGVVAGFQLTGVEDLPLANVVMALVSSGITAVGLLVLVFRYRLRIDHRGVWRRWIVRWDLWPWEAFEEGKVRHGQAGDQLTFPEKRWYWRTISTSLLSEADRTAFEAVVRRYRVPPPPPDLPEVVSLRQGLRTELELSPAGVRVGEGAIVPWGEVVQVELVRANHDRSDFVTLDLQLPGDSKPIRLFRRQGQSSWRGPEADVVALYVRRYLDDDRFRVTALRGPPASVAEADRRLGRLAELQRRLRILSRITWIMLAALGIVMFVPWDWNNPVNWGQADWLELGIKIGAATVTLGMLAAMMIGFVYFLNRDLRRQRDELLGWRTAFGAVTSHR